MKNVKKIEKVNKKNKNRKFKFGRNMMTFVIIFIGVIVLFFGTYLPITAVSLTNSTTVKPFVSGYVPSGMPEALHDHSDGSEHHDDEEREFVRISNEEYVEKYNHFDINIDKVEFNKTKTKITISYKENANTKKLPNFSASNYKKYAAVCLASSNVGTCNYATSNQLTTNISFTKAGGYSYTISFNDTVETDNFKHSYPFSVSKWPFTKTESRPSIYVYLYYTYLDTKTNKDKVCEFVVEYTAEDYESKVPYGFPQ